MSERTVEVFIEPYLVSLAHSYSNTVSENLSKNPNYTGLETSNRYFIGRLGELAFAKWAQRAGLLFSDTVRSDGISDAQDFVFRPSGLTVNVKNSDHIRARNLLQPIAQHNRHHQDFLVGATTRYSADGPAVTLHGAISQNDWNEQAELVSLRIPTMSMRLDHLPLSMPQLGRLLGHD